MLIDVSNMDALVRGYITKILKEKHPLLDTSPNSVFDDIFIKPMIDVIKPLLKKIDKLELQRNLNNAEYMTQEEFDEIGEGNYFTPRKEGNYASTLLTLTFTNINVDIENFELQVPAGIIFQGPSDLQYQTKTDTVFSADDMRKGYDKIRMVYEVQVVVEAMGVGAEYNIPAGEIKSCATPFHPALVSVTNKSDITDGSDKEDNAAYAERIRDFAISRHLGTDPGYESFVRETFSEVEDVYIAGKGDEYMERDLLTVYDENTKSLYKKHIGGMVDIYIKGFLLEATDATLLCKSGTIILPVEFDKLEFKDLQIKDNFEIFNMTDETKKPSIKSVSKVETSDYSGEYTGQTKIVLDNTLDASYDSNSVSLLKITFKHITGGVKRVDEHYVDVGITESDLASPLKSIISVKAEGLPDTYSNNITYSLTTEGEKGTTQERTKIKLENIEDIPNSRPIIVTHSVNETLRQMAEIFTDLEYKIITTDVLGREAEQVPVNVQFRVKTINGKLDEGMKARMQASVVSFFDAYKLGDQIEESDIVAWMYSDPNIKNQIQYIALPFDVFYIPKNPSDDIPYDDKSITQPADGVLPIKAIQYPVLNSSKFSITTA